MLASTMRPQAICRSVLCISIIVLQAALPNDRQGISSNLQHLSPGILQGCIAAAQACGNRAAEGACCHQLGLIAQQKGEFSEALQCQDTFLELIGEVQTPSLLYHTLLVAGCVAQCMFVASSHKLCWMICYRGAVRGIGSVTSPTTASVCSLCPLASA